jgi:AcrR family transcriptional regulator
MGKSETADQQKSKKTAAKPAASKARRGNPETSAKRHYLPADERRQRILDSAREVFARTGLQGARTRDLAKAAGINQATLFAHFESKEDLFAAAVLQPLVALFEGIRERYQVYEAADSPQDLLGLLQAGMQKHLENMVEIYPLLVHALSDQTLGKHFYVEQILPLFKARTSLMRNLIKDSLDPELVELASFGMFFAIAMDRVMTGKTDDLSSVSRQLTDLLILGVSRNQWVDPQQQEEVPARKTAKKPGRKKS